eukprot:TRINITY_DN242_c2_g1_i1.p1 TRINITY_DN242_c2_g1~~TRINITY_DN242_c2_g1_i1.p1  ORF type:complete len:207 (+),score=33.96 TRINITY_DN242_c2_g1_i1:56-676(+)
MQTIFRTATSRKFARTLIARHGVTDDDRRWWEWHIPARAHKGRDTTVLYCDGVGRYTWKMLIEEEVFTIHDLSKITDDQVAELERNGCLQISVAREHARVFIETMDERERELSLQQSSWDNEVERLIEQRDQANAAFRRSLEAGTDRMKEQRQRTGDEQREQIQKVIDTYDFGKVNTRRYEKERFDHELGRDIEVEDDEPVSNPFK